MENHRKDRRFALLTGLGIALSIGLTACGGNANATKAPDCSWAQHPADTANIVAADHFDKAPASCITKTTAGTYTATLHTKKGDVVVTLDQQDAPASVNNFVFLATHHFYDNVLFHQVAPNLLVQSGDPNSVVPGATLSNSDGPGYTIPNEYPQSSTVFAQGCLAMANYGTGTTGSQFFICTADDSKKLAYYNYFGKVTSGMDIVSQITQGDVITSIDIAKS